MADFNAGAGKTQDELGADCSDRNQGSVPKTKRWGMSKGHRG